MSATMAARARTGASLSAPVRRAQPARRKSPSWFAQTIRAAIRRPGRSMLFLMFGLLSLAIVANALMFQKVRHPRPMLAAPVEEARPAASARRGEPPAAPVMTPPADIPALLGPALPPSRPSDLSQAQPTARETAPRPPAAVAAAPRTAAPARNAVVHDPIADLINGTGIRPPAEIRGANARSGGTPRHTASN